MDDYGQEFDQKLNMMKQDDEIISMMGRLNDQIGVVALMLVLRTICPDNPEERMKLFEQILASWVKVEKMIIDQEAKSIKNFKTENEGLDLMLGLLGQQENVEDVVRSKEMALEEATTRARFMFKSLKENV
jgi:hypothetical protein